MSLFLVERPDRGWVPAAVSSRLQSDWRMLERLERQLPVAKAIMLQTFRDGLALLQGVMKASRFPSRSLNRMSLTLCLCLAVRMG